MDIAILLYQKCFFKIKTIIDTIWEILARTKSKFNSKHGCTLCNMEKYEISKLNSNIALNKRKELFSTCKHFSKHYFK